MSMQEANSSGLYITHTGSCGVCSSLQDLAAMLEYNRLLQNSNGCYLTGLTNFAAGIECYQNYGYSRNCAEVLLRYQLSIRDEGCGTNCPPFALDGDQSQPSCGDDASGCAACAANVRSRMLIVSGRTFANSGYPSATAVPCDRISSMVPEQGDICLAASGPAMPTDAPVAVVTVAPTPAPVATTSTAAPVAATPSPVVATSPPVASSPELQQCLEMSALEERLGLSVGSSITCECTESAEVGAAVVPVCYQGDRADNNQCATMFGTCVAVGDCCSAGVRTCRSGQCRSASRGALKSSLRIGSNSAIRGDRPGGGAAGGGDGGGGSAGSGGTTRGLRRRLRIMLGRGATTSTDGRNGYPSTTA
jgi:uncharacterized membrane protein YgcG